MLLNQKSQHIQNDHRANGGPCALPASACQSVPDQAVWGKAEIVQVETVLADQAMVAARAKEAGVDGLQTAKARNN